MPGPVFREGETVSLRAIEPSDHAYLATQANRRDVRRMTNGQEPWSHDGKEAFLDDDDVVGFLLSRDGERVGFCWLFFREEVHGRAAIGYWVDPDARREGVATAAVSLLKAYAVDELRLRKLHARVFEGNDASASVLESNGFENVGRLHEHYLVDGAYLDARLYEWLSPARSE
ncbi:GCN5-related N-acetyltransferase [Halorhabdus utahensis DSM 12940]|uniref:GCN5-related N-acetyltransferase n=1 Tax=Halorhabdus utahensis (strain DSM 12940 / JCM 11049 / AX-2) TaxID=519442 RepID=C7NMG9_HALUD|nr:GNAT family N-acetyltransferase [Halorhabdus utahensis]ACV12608.1 GCN5-related N-acetyltransferase [Halorhabdus utahensis DSM 12940]